MEDLEDTQYFDELALPDVIPPYDGKHYLVMKVTNLLREERTSQIMIYLIQSMLTFHNIKSKILMSIIPKTTLGKEKISVWYKYIINEKHLTTFK